MEGGRERGREGGREDGGEWRDDGEEERNSTKETVHPHTLPPPPCTGAPSHPHTLPPSHLLLALVCPQNSQEAILVEEGPEGFKAVEVGAATGRVREEVQLQKLECVRCEGVRV